MTPKEQQAFLKMIKDIEAMRADVAEMQTTINSMIETNDNKGDTEQ